MTSLGCTTLAEASGSTEALLAPAHRRRCAASRKGRDRVPAPQPRAA
jgi:hypothetical protein